MEEPAATKVEFVEPTKAEECAPPAVAPTPSKVRKPPSQHPFRAKAGHAPCAVG